MKRQLTNESIFTQINDWSRVYIFVRHRLNAVLCQNGNYPTISISTANRPPLGVVIICPIAKRKDGSNTVGYFTYPIRFYRLITPYLELS